jgi:hypothetical protein
MPRDITHHYEDPANLIWLAAASRLGMTVRRSPDVYAAWDGKGTLTLASDEHLDPDDCLAQMIFHEICHLLVSGEEARNKPDWGVDNTSSKDLLKEYATNRLQAALAGAYGLRTFMGVTTMWRSYYDNLPRDPLAPITEPASMLASTGLLRARKEPYCQVLHQALSATATIAGLVQEQAAAHSLWRTVPRLHPSGFRQHADENLFCRTCAWASRCGDHELACRKSRPGYLPGSYSLIKTRIDTAGPAFPQDQGACEHYEPVLTEADCPACGACCHRGFDVVEVKPREKFVRLHPELVETRAPDRTVVPRYNGRCVALQGDGGKAAPYRCAHYADRPKSCRDFQVGGDGCLSARLRCRVFKS